ncbi:hypothetical protein GCM10022381_29040 [Leifsonia kafniensis]|uniref:DUF1566 domain-containing protein n=1 Tax=Leifsonia kafniensis TaxID=475957 RepID=A0ABP7KPY4_9MICO
MTTLLTPKRVIARSPHSPGAVAIDLGLSVHWAAHNLGARLPQEYGGLYGWADPSGEQVSTQVDDYPSSTPPSEISGTPLDLARTRWGATWRMPTLTEFEELVTECSWEEGSVDRIRGYRVIGRSGRSIFLPAAGSRSGLDLHARVGRANYWSGTLSGHPIAAYSLHIEDEGLMISPQRRDIGLAIRPVGDPRR